VSRPRAADDFAAIRARMEELRRERGSSAAGDPAEQPLRRPDSELERRRRIAGWPPPWAPAIAARRGRR
jgi:hypothetical protein